jgi:ABC-type polysaccharide/polyol phosphate export permease
MHGRCLHSYRLASSFPCQLTTNRLYNVYFTITYLSLLTSCVSLSILIVMYVPFCVFCLIVLFCLLSVCKCVVVYCYRDIGAPLDYLI